MTVSDCRWPMLAADTGDQERQPREMTNMVYLGQTIADALVAQYRREQRAKRLRDLSRPVGERGVWLGCYNERLTDENMRAREPWAVWLVRWNGTEWKRTRRLSGPLADVSDALHQATNIARQRKLQRID